MRDDVGHGNDASARTAAKEMNYFGGYDALDA